MEAGLVSVLILLLLFLSLKNPVLVPVSIALIVIALVAPWFFYPVAILWFGAAKILGKFMPQILLTVIFFLLVTPVAIIRRLAGKDRLCLKEFKKDRSSVLVTRNHLYSSDDLTDTF